MSSDYIILVESVSLLSYGLLGLCFKVMMSLCCNNNNNLVMNIKVISKALFIYYSILSFYSESKFYSLYEFMLLCYSNSNDRSGDYLVNM